MRASRAAACAVACAGIAALLWFALGARREDTAPERTPPPDRGAGPEGATLAATRAGTPPAAPAPSSADPAAGTAPDAAWRVSGRVVANGLGFPVAGATVFVGLVRDDGREGLPLPAATSGADGTWSVSLDALKGISPWARGGRSLRLTAWAYGYGPSAVATVSPWPQGDEPVALNVNLGLPPGDVVVGRVLREDGAPLAGARVFSCDGEGRRAREDGALSGPDGRFALLRPERGWSLVATSPRAGVGYAPLGGREEVEIVVHARATVDGWVVYADGSPAAGVRVEGSVTPETGEVGACLGRDTDAEAVTSADGSFRLPFAQEGRCGLRVHGVGGVRARTGDRDVRIVAREHRVRVRVLDPAGAEVLGAGVTAIAWLPGHAARFEELRSGAVGPETAWAAADGVSSGFRLEDFDRFGAPGSVLLVLVQSAGFAPGEAWTRIPEDRNETDLVVRLASPQRGGRLRIVARDETGAPAGPLRARIRTLLGGTLWDGVLPPEGVVGPLPAGRSWVSVTPSRPPNDRVYAGLPPFDSWLLPGSARADVTEGAVTDVAFTLPAGGRVRVRLRPPSGAPAPAGDLPAYYVTFRPVSGGEFPSPLLYVEGPSGAAPRTFGEVLHHAGPLVTASPLPPGEYVASIRYAHENTPAARGNVRVLPRRVTDMEIEVPSPK